MLLLTIFVLPLMSSQPHTPTMDDFSWLAGCWSNTERGRIYDEQWMKPAGKTMLGMSRTVANGKTREYEFVRIVQDTTGAIYYIANPSGQQEASFKLIKSNKHEVIFENPEHDFPQRIIYRLVGSDSLVARIEGTIKGKERSSDFPMKRATCL